MKIRFVLLFAVAMAVGCKPVDVEGASKTSATAPTTLPPVVDEILIASSRIEAGEELTDELVETFEIGKKYVTPDMLASSRRGDVIGRVADKDIPEGALLHDRDFNGTDVASPDDQPKLEALVIAEANSPMREIPNKARAALIARGSEAYLGTLTIQPGAGVPQHRDQTEEFLYVLEGGGTITIDGISHEIVPAMAVFMPAEAEVAFQNGDAVTRVVQVFGGPGPATKYDSWQEVAADPASEDSSADDADAAVAE
jgi:quercetin dioxygenase-like cupin family protein